MTNSHKEQPAAPEQTNHSTDALIARRTFLTYSVFAGAGVMLAACGGANEPVVEGEAESCAESVSLSISQRANRTALSYVDISENLVETCANCQYFAHAENNAMCGSCTVVSGPIAPEGYCTAWAPIES